MSIVTEYLKGIQKHFSARDKEQFSLVHGASPEDIEKLKAAYPLCPDSLIEFLNIVDGTYHRIYDKKNYVCIFMLGSDINQYPYFILSVQEILEEREYDETIFERYMDNTVSAEDNLEDFVEVDPKIDVNAHLKYALCFSYCMNNGGTSRLYIDFNPTEKGKVGQIVRYEHDPDSYAVIADSFDEYLQNIIDNDFEFMVIEDDDE